MRKIGGVLLLTGTFILTVWGIVQWFRELFPSVPNYVSFAVVITFLGLCLLIASLIKERIKDTKEDKNKFRGIEK
jgi:putative Mn2+ efflux pump MntP